MKSVWTRRDGLCFLLVFAVSLSVYTLSLPDSVTLEDAGELVVAADYLGVPHPPGYPIWTFLAWLFQWLLHGLQYRGYPDPARAVAWMSAVFGSLACGLSGMLIGHFCRGLARIRPERASFRPHDALPGTVGSALGLAVAGLLQLLPGAGTFFLAALLYFWGLLLSFRGLSPTPTRWRWASRLPDFPALAAALRGFLIVLGLWYAVWSWLVIPALSLLLPLSLAVLLALTLLRLLLRQALNRAVRRTGFRRDFRRSGWDLVLGVSGGLLLAFTPLMWSQSIIAEVYSLNAFFLSLLLVGMTTYLHRPREGLLSALAFCFGLGLTNHQSLLFLIFFLMVGIAAAGQRALLKDGIFLMGLGFLALLLFKARQYQGIGDPSARDFFLGLGILTIGFLLSVLATGGGLFTQWRRLLRLAALGMLGLSFHLFMPVASEQNPPMNWGNTRTPEGFQHALTRGQYARFTVADNFRSIVDAMRTPVDPAWLNEGQEAKLAVAFARRTDFPRKLGAYFYDPDWKTSIASQFSWQFPLTDEDPNGRLPPAPERQIPLALFGLLPLCLAAAFPPRQRGWFRASVAAMLCVTLVFLIVQWPELNQNDLWVKRVQYVQSHLLYAIWMSLGAALSLMLLYAILPSRWVPRLGAPALAMLFVAFPLHKEFRDPRHLEQLGASWQRGHDFGWRFGFHQLRGANGILLDELAHHRDPDCLIDDRAVAWLAEWGMAPERITALRVASGNARRGKRAFRREVLGPLRLSPAEARQAEEAAMLAAFRALSPEEQTASLIHLPSPLPDWDYPAEMAPGAILFGGTDPGRFVPTYLIFSADVRPDLFLLTQTALADASYLQTARDLYGDRIYLPDLIDSNRAFLDYANELRLFAPEEYGQLMSNGEVMSISGLKQVHRINSRLSRKIFEENRGQHAFYFEEAILIDWMIPHLRPHGLVFKLEAEPGVLSREEVRQNFAFWDWYEAWMLTPDPRHPEGRNRYQRDLQARKSFSKLRMSQAWNFYERGLRREAERAMDQAIRLYPANPEAGMRAADLAMRQLDFDKARERIEAYAPHDPTNEQLGNFAVALRKLEALNEERQVLEQELASRVTGNTTLKLLQIYGQLEMRERMEEMAEMLLRLPDLHPDFFIHLAAFMQRREHPELYKRAVEEWCRRDPEDARAWIDLAVVALAEERWEEMLRHLLQAVKLEPLRARRQIANDPRFLDIRHWRQFQQLLRPPAAEDPPLPRLPGFALP